MFSHCWYIDFLAQMVSKKRRPRNCCHAKCNYLRYYSTTSKLSPTTLFCLLLFEFSEQGPLQNWKDSFHKRPWHSDNYCCVMSALPLSGEEYKFCNNMAATSDDPKDYINGNQQTTMKKPIGNQEMDNSIKLSRWEAITFRILREAVGIACMNSKPDCLRVIYDTIRDQNDLATLMRASFSFIPTD